MNENKKNPVLERIIELRDARHWTNYELADAAKVSSAMLYNLERRNTVPRIELLSRLCAGLEITIEQFFCGLNNQRLSEDERKLLWKFICLPDKAKEAIMFILNQPEE